MSFYLYDEPLRLYLHYTICWVLKTYNLYSCGCIFVVEVHEQSLPAIILLFLGQLSQRGGTDILDRIFFSSTVVAVEFSWNQWGKSPFFLWNVIGFRLPAFGSHVYYLVLMHSDPSPFPPPRLNTIYSRLPHNPFFSHREYYSYYIIHCSYYGY